MTITELLDKYHIPYKIGGEHHHVREQWIGTDCPYCSANSEHYRLGFHVQGKRASCWSCGYLPLLRTLHDVTHASYAELTALLGDIETATPSSRTRTRTQGKLLIPTSVSPMQTAHKKYLLSRGFNPEEIERIWKVQGVGLAAHLAWRLFIPVIYQGKIVSWTTRSIAEGNGLRYISAKPEEESIALKSLLYGEDFVRHTIIVCEGPTDVWRIGPGTVCTFGTAYTEEQTLRISRYPRRVILFDSEAAAQQQARRLASELQVFPGETCNVEIDAKDPGSLGKKAVREIRETFL